jgi:peptide deformylase
MPKILQEDETRVLREKTHDVPVEDIGSPALQKLIADMKAALASQEDGVAIAAPQIGSSMRVFVVSGRVWDIERPEEEQDQPSLGRPDMVFINPKLTKLSRDKQEMEEGCLSVRWKYGKVLRSEKATVRAYDEHGKVFELGGKGLLAQIFQHETDHLDGILFIDKAKEVFEVSPEELAGKESSGNSL